MQVGRLGGLLSDDVTPGAVERVEIIVQANRTIEVGQVCGHLATTTVNPSGASITNTSRPMVVTPVGAAAASDHLAMGVYEGRGQPSGVATTFSGLTGQHANTSDLVLLTVYGLAKAKVDGDTTDASVGTPLTPSVTETGVLSAIVNSATVVLGYHAAQFIMSDTAVTGTTVTAAWVYVKSM